MTDQLKQEPDLYIPKILKYLSDCIVQFGGLKSEGIFRISGDVSQVSELRYDIERGIYSSDKFNDCNVYASVFKAWFRELEPPIIPIEYYHEIIENKNNKQDLMEIINKLSKYNQDVINFTINYLKLFSKEENFVVNKMSSTNLATVFAPNFLRNPTKNSEFILQDSKNEQQVVYTLLKN